MRRIASAVIVVVAVLLSGTTGAISVQVQTPQPPAPQASTEKPTIERAPDALERVTWRTRTLVGDDRLTNWNFALPGGGLTFLEAVVRADAAVVDFVEGSSAQKVSPQVLKNLDPALTPEEIAGVRSRMGGVRMFTYRVTALPADPPSQRTLFEFAKAMNVDTIVVPPGTTIGGLEALADEFSMNVAVVSDTARPAGVMKALEGKSKRLGIGIDTGLWAQEGVAPRGVVAAVKDRLLYLNLRDRSGPGATARNVALGEGAGNLKEFFDELNRLNVRPLAMTLDTTGVVKAPGDVFKAVEAFEATVQPAYAANFTVFSRSRPIRWDVARAGRGESPSAAALDKEAAETRQKIVAAIPKQPYAKPRQARKLLVIESLQGMSHNTIPHTNVMLEEMGKITAAWTTEFNNDLNNLRHPKIKDYDAVFLNSIVGEFLPDPELRDSLARFVREGGGLGGIHGTPWASRNWDEFAEMIGAQSAPHRIEQGVMKVSDPASPLMKPFGGKDLNVPRGILPLRA